jgi:hypothetical protein
MKPVYVYVALLDVLAYRQHLEADRKSGRLDFAQKLLHALRVFDDVNNAVFRVQAISDTIIITCPGHEHFPKFLQLLREVFLAFLGQGLFVRGGVAYSQHFQNNNMTYSHAVAKAYELESTLAEYPRIVIDGNIIGMYEGGDGLPNIKSCGLISAENGVHFVEVLTKDNWSLVYESAKVIYASSVDVLRVNERAFGKHVRFERYVLSSPYAPTSAARFINTAQTL